MFHPGLPSAAILYHILRGNWIRNNKRLVLNGFFAARKYIDLRNGIGIQRPIVLSVQISLRSADKILNLIEQLGWDIQIPYHSPWTPLVNMHLFMFDGFGVKLA